MGTVLALLATGQQTFAQELDLDLMPSAVPTKLDTSKPISVTVTKTLYLPPAMYGQWNVRGVLLETNAPDYFRPVADDIWVLQRDGDEVTISNPTTGASASINVDKVEGDEATFHRTGPAGHNKIFSEMPTIRVQGDRMIGKSINRIELIKAGKVVRMIYAYYALEAVRISGARVQFKPEEASADGPDLQIEDIQSGGHTPR